MKRTAARRGRTVAFTVCIGLIPGLTHAQTLKRFDIPAGPLAETLRRVADLGGAQILFHPADVAGRKSPGVHGPLTTGQALRAALGGNPLDVQAVDADTYVVRPALPSAPQAPSHPALAPARMAEPAPAAIAPPEVVIVTAHAGAMSRTRLQSSYAVTRLDASALDMAAPLSDADMLRAVPGLWVEASGGQASNNIRARGIPRDGYSSLAVFEDGLPIQHDAGLGYLNADQSFRLDETLSAVEVVRGGPSSIFASNAPGGIINLIPRRPTEKLSGIFRVQTGSADLARLDGWIGGPLSDWRLATGGFFRRDDGLRDTGFPADAGGQWRLTALRPLAHGELSLDYKHIDDKVAFYLPVPLQQDTKGNIGPVPGFDPLRDTLTGPDAARAVLRDAQGNPYPFDLTRGTQTRLDQYTLKLVEEAGPDGKVTLGLRLRRSQTWRNGLFPGFPGLTTAKLSPYLAAAQTIYPATASLGVQYVANAQPFNTLNGLIIDATLSSVRVPLDEALGDLRYDRLLTTGSVTHNLVIGLYMADMHMRMLRLTSTTLLEVAPQARRLDIVALDASGRPLGVITRDGITRDGAQFDNIDGREAVAAVYGSDEIELNDRWRVDVAARIEHQRVWGTTEVKATIAGPDPMHISDDAMITGTGVLAPVAHDYTEPTLSAGLLRTFDPSTSAYARLTRTVRLPNISDLTDGSNDAHDEPIWLGEAGVKQTTHTHDIHIVAFVTAFSGYRFTDNIFDAPSNAYVQKVAFADTLSYGLELEGLWRPLPHADIAFSATAQEPKFGRFRYTDIVYGQPVARDYSGHQLLRVPKLMVRVTPGVTLDQGRLRLETTVEHYGPRFADAANQMRLPGYTTVAATLRYHLTPRLDLFFNGDNLTNALGLTEGNPRSGQLTSSDAGATWFAARPIFGRNWRASLQYRF